MILSAVVSAVFLAGCVSMGASGEYYSDYPSGDYPTGGGSTGVSFDLFYSNLSPHGTWLVSAEYGRVWQPREYDRDWNPYYDGRWVYSDYGWTWVSDYSWGAIPYHYGTWYADSRYGWVWVPGTVWAPSWVVFRTGPDYIGWCPVSPRFSVSASFGFDEPRGDMFVFVSSRDFLSPRIRTAVVVDNRRTTIINNTRIVNNITVENNIVVNRGVDVATVERASGHQVRRYRIEEVAKVAPGRTVDREQLRADRHGSRELRATEPVTREPKPSPWASGRDDRDQARDEAESRRDSRRPYGRPEARDPDERRPDARQRNPRQDRPEQNRPDQSQPDQRDRDRKHEDWLNPRDSGPGGRPAIDTPDQPNQDEARKPQKPKRPPRDDRKKQEQKKQKDKEKEHKPEEDKPPQDNGGGARG
jgi:hypothetical protein